MTSISDQFQELMVRRTSQLDRARDCSELTVPTLLPRTGFTSSDDLPDLYSSLGARGAMSLASRITSAIYPLNQLPFFQHELDMQYVPPGEDTTELENALNRLDRTIMDKLSETNLRQELFVLYQHLIVLGDALLYQSDDYDFRVIRMDQYVLRRRPDGTVTQIIVREWVDPEALPVEWTNVPDTPHHGMAYGSGPSSDHEPCFTKLDLQEDGTWESEKEFRDAIVDSGSFEVSPYSPQTWSRVAGEDYGRSLVEENLGDLRSLEQLSKALIEGSAANSEYRVGIRPGGIGNIGDMQDTANGDYIVAEQGDVWSFQLNNQVQLQTTANARDMLSRDLGRTFLLASATQPTGERVTATQIRELAAELDQALGGVFSGAARDIQIPIVRRTMALMVRDRMIDPAILNLVGGIMRLKIRTGLEALNREAENQRLVQWSQIVMQIPDAMQAVNWSNFLTKFTSSFGLETTGLVKTADQVQSEQQAAAQAQIGQQVAGQAISSLGSIAEEQAKA